MKTKGFIGLLLDYVKPIKLGVTEYGDIPSGSLRGEVITHAALASNAASTAYGIGTDAQRFRAPQDCIIVGVDFEPVGANQVATSLTSYRIFTAYNASTDGAGTAVLGSINLSATLASNAVRAYTMQTVSASATLAAGEIVAISQTTVGGDHSVGTVVVAPAHHIRYRPI